MSLDEVKKRFVEEVKLRAYDDKYIDKNEEREILQIALQQGVTVDSALPPWPRSAKATATSSKAASSARSRTSSTPSPATTARSTRRSSTTPSPSAKMRTLGKKNDVQVKRMVLEVIEENSFKVKTGMFSNWYARVKKDVGMA